MIISIDGPAGAGKSTIAGLVAQKLGYIHFNSGLLYRGITAHIITNNLDLESIDTDTQLNLSVQFINNQQRVYVNNHDYTSVLRDNNISQLSPIVSMKKIIRNIVDNCQRKFASEHNCVIDGRDIGSYVFPNADVKFYLDCDVAERARRRYKEEIIKNPNITLNQIQKELIKRDEIDRNKPFARLMVPDNAIIVDSTNLTIDEVVDKMISIIKQKK